MNTPILGEMLVFTVWRCWDGVLVLLLPGHLFLLFQSHCSSWLLPPSLSLIHTPPSTVSCKIRSYILMQYSQHGGASKSWVC